MTNPITPSLNGIEQLVQNYFFMDSSRESQSSKGQSLGVNPLGFYPFPSKTPLHFEAGFFIFNIRPRELPPGVIYQ
jgi:hypothetical protein